MWNYHISSLPGIHIFAFASLTHRQRLYHFNERLAARANREPRIPERDLWAIFNYIHHRYNTQHIERDFDGKAIQTFCRSMTKKTKNPKWARYAERWVQIKVYMVGKENWIDPWLSDVFEMKIQGLARLASRCFDVHFYKPGKRHTSKDGLYNSNHMWARHNFPNYNFSLQQFHLIIGYREGGLEKAIELWKYYKAYYYFPLLKTPSVILHLHQLWDKICEYCFFPLFDIGKQIDDWPMVDQPPLPNLVYDYSTSNINNSFNPENQNIHVTITSQNVSPKMSSNPQRTTTMDVDPPGQVCTLGTL